MGQQIDYDKLAREHGGTVVTTPTVDYDALAADISAPAASPTAPTIPQPFAGLGIQTVSDEDWAKMTPTERLQGVLKAAGYGLSTMFGMGEPGRQGVDNPGTTLAFTALGAGGRAARPLIPSSTRAGARFQEVMGATKNVPVNINDPGSVALRIQQLAERGATMPKVARDFLKRVTDPAKPPMVYEEARDFYHNISRLSADEFKRLTPVMKREVGNLRTALNRSIEGAAQQAGKLSEYQSAMREYARRAQLDDLASDIWQGTKRALPFAGVTAAATWGASKLSDLVNGR